MHKMATTHHPLYGKYLRSYGAIAVNVITGKPFWVCKIAPTKT